MVQRKVIVRGATNQALDELDATDIPDLSAAYEAAGGIATHSADTTVVHGITDTSALSLTSHEHDADYEAAGGIATHSADTTAVHGLADTSVLATDTEVATAVSDHSADTSAVHGIADTSAVSLTSHDHDADYEAAGGIATHAGAADPHTGYQKESEKSAVSGYASLDAGTKVPLAELPTGTSGTTVALGDAAAALDATHAAAGDPHAGYRLESADHSHASTGLQAGTVAHTALTAVGVNDHHAQAHAADHLPTGTDAVNKFSQAGIGTADLAVANTETVVVAKTFAANELTAGMTFMFKAYATRAGTTSASPIIRIRIGTTTLTGNIAATLTPPVNTLAVGNSIEGIVTIRSAGAGGTALGSLMHTVHLAAVTITESLGVSTATVAVDTTAANQKVELTFISGNAANTYTWRNAVIYRVA